MKRAGAFRPPPLIVMFIYQLGGDGHRTATTLRCADSTEAGDQHGPGFGFGHPRNRDNDIVERDIGAVGKRRIGEGDGRCRSRRNEAAGKGTGQAEVVGKRQIGRARLAAEIIGNILRAATDIDGFEAETIGSADDGGKALAEHIDAGDIAAAEEGVGVVTLRLRSDGADPISIGRAEDRVDDARLRPFGRAVFKIPIDDRCAHCGCNR